MSGLWAAVKTQKRRLSQKAISRLSRDEGDEESTADAEYQANRADFLEMCDAVTKTQSDMVKFAAAAAKLAAVASSLAESISAVQGAETQAKAEQLRAFSESLSPVLQTNVEAHVEALKAKGERLAEVKARVKQRDNTKIDFDSYTRRVKTIRTKEKPDPKNLLKFENKLAGATARLQEESAQVDNDFAGFRRGRSTLIQAELDGFMKDASSFIGSLNKAMDNCKSNGSGSVGNPFSTSAVSQGAIAAAAAVRRNSLKKNAPEKPSSAPPAATGGFAPGSKAKVIYDFKPAADDELAAKVGDILVITKVVDENWVSARSENGNSEGIIPRNHIHAV